MSAAAHWRHAITPDFEAILRAVPLTSEPVKIGDKKIYNVSVPNYPALARAVTEAWGEAIAEKRGLIRDLTTALEHRNRQFAVAEARVTALTEALKAVALNGSDDDPLWSWCDEGWVCDHRECTLARAALAATAQGGTE